MALALGSLVTMMLLEGTNPLAVVLLPPLVLVFGATFGAAVAGSTVPDPRPRGPRLRGDSRPRRRPAPARLLVPDELRPGTDGAERFAGRPARRAGHDGAQGGHAAAGES